MRGRKRLAAFFSAVCLALGLSGCRIGNTDVAVNGGVGSRQVFQIDGSACGVKEARVYLTNYQNIYGTAYTINLWEHDFGDDSLEEYVKAMTLEELVCVYCMDLLAKSREMSLTEEEAGSVAAAAAEYYASLTKEEIDSMGVSEADINEYYTRYALAQKLYHSLTNEVNGEVSDDEARVMEIMQIFVSDGTRAAEVEKKLNDGDDFATVAGNYNELSSIHVTVSRDDLPDEVEEIAFAMDDNQVSGRIEVDNGYYFIRCINKYDRELTEENKATIVEKREKEAFDDVYNGFVSSLDTTLNEEVWEQLVPDTGEGITTDSFFTVFEKYCSDI